MLSYTDAVCNKILEYTTKFPIPKTFSNRAVSKELGIDESEIDAALTAMKDKYVNKAKGYFDLRQDALLFWKDGGFKEHKDIRRASDDPKDANNFDYVHDERIAELRVIKSELFDLRRLIALCEELNFNYRKGSYLSVAMLLRSITNHIPPIFGFTTFNEVSSNYGTRSFKKNMEHLNVSMRSIADSFLHDTIRKTESLPVATQVNFSQNLDVLLAEVIRKLKE
jgi:hypothetical protein